jgi:uncharacterized protein (TIGR03067 family)
MRMLLLAVVAMFLVAADAGDKAEKPTREHKKFTGTWALESGEKDGEKLSDEHVKKSKITWTGDKVTVHSPHQSKERIEARITRLDPTKSPPEMDFLRSAGPGTVKPILAIYQFIGDDKYKICFDPSGKERPREFKTTPGSGHILHVWKRVRE